MGTLSRRLSLVLGILLGLLVGVQPAAAQAAEYPLNPRLGIAHISSAEGGTPTERYQQALVLGAAWNRYPIYWDRVETAPQTFAWEAYDIQIRDDLQHGLSINAILLGRPAFRAEGDRIAGLNEPIFADGSDFPGAGKVINPDNPWAVFVYETVTRYRPNGTLAQAEGWTADEGVRVWEIWNEPDYKPFWGGSIRDYARLLKVAYLAVKHADPDGQVMFAGLLYSGQDNWLARVLALYINDPYAEQFNWYMDIVAIHSYADPWRTGWLVLNVRQTLIAYDIDRPIWVTETGVPVWDDYPGPVWAVGSTEAHETARLNRSTQLQQAWFVIQSAAYAWTEGADVVIFHQLYDDCGDQPAGTDFPPHRGELCRVTEFCAGDAHGFYRNLNSSVCFSQSPHAGAPRLSAYAYALLAQVFSEPFARGTYLDLDPDVVAMQFDRLNTAERVVVLWTRKQSPVTVQLPAIGTNAQRITLTQNALIVPDADDTYTLTLPPAHPDNYPDLPFGAESAIGGEPFILIERLGGDVEPLAFSLEITADLATTTSPSLTGDVAPVASVATTAPPFRPTVDPLNDTRPPTAMLEPLPEVSPAVFSVVWGGQDDSGIAAYTVWVRRDSDEWQVWLETAETQAEFQGVAGSVYAFDVWAVDLAGNWSSRVTLEAQTSTRIDE